MGAVIVVWGCNWPIMKIALREIEPLTFAFARLAMGAICLFALLAATGRLRLPGRADMPVVLSVALLQLAAFMALINLGLARVDAGRSVILCYTTLIWVTPIAAIFLDERLTKAKAAGLALGLGGIVTLFNPFGFDWRNEAALAGNAMLLGAAFLWAITIVHIKTHRFALTPLQLAPWQMIIGTLPVAVLAFVWEDPLALWPSANLWLTLAYNGPLATAFTLWAWTTVTRALPAITTAMASLAVPVVGALSSMVVLNEAIGTTNIVGFALILAGLAAISAETATRAKG